MSFYVRLSTWQPERKITSLTLEEKPCWKVHRFFNQWRHYTYERAINYIFPYLWYIKPHEWTIIHLEILRFIQCLDSTAPRFASSLKSRFDLILFYVFTIYCRVYNIQFVIVSIDYCKRDVIPMLAHLSYVSLAITHWYYVFLSHLYKAQFSFGQICMVFHRDHWPPRQYPKW